MKTRPREKIIEYASEKKSVWILFDNLDKGWAANGIDASDLLSLRCLIEGLRKLARDFKKAGVECNGVVFVRNDIYEVLVNNTPDRGKVNRVSLDWTDPDLLLEMLRRRFLYALRLEKQDAPQFSQLWNSIAVSHLNDGQETSGFVLARSLLRPRTLLDFLHHCKSHAVNLNHARLDDSDFVEGERNFSTELVAGISLEIQDVLPWARDALYAFVEAPNLLSADELEARMSRSAKIEGDQTKLLDLLLWYGFFGIQRSDLSETYIYTVSYDMRKLKALIDNTDRSARRYPINPAFWRGLEVKVH